MKYDFIVVGAGIIGLSTAFSLSKKFQKKNILILEKESEVSQHQTGNNSGVIHSGVYYKPNSLKAINCQKGYKLLIEFAKEHKIDYDICGKIIVATKKEELEILENIYERGVKNGLKGLKFLNSNEIKEIEPHCLGIKAIHVPQAGIINYKQVANKLAELLIQKNVDIILNEKVENIISGETVKIVTKNKIYEGRKVITCGGLFSDRIASYSNKIPNLRIIPFRGEYYELKKESRKLVRNLIYPVPNPSFPFLGVHFTRMIGGGIEAGPNAVLAFKREGYSFFDFNLKDFLETILWPGFWKIAFKFGRIGIYEIYRSLSKKAFTKALKKLIPEINEDDLIKGGAGVRAQVCSIQGDLLDDFEIQQKNNIVNVINAPSPAATSAFAIGQMISNKLNKTI